MHKHTRELAPISMRRTRTVKEAHLQFKTFIKRICPNMCCDKTPCRHSRRAYRPMRPYRRPLLSRSAAAVTSSCPPSGGCSVKCGMSMFCVVCVCARAWKHSSKTKTGVKTHECRMQPWPKRRTNIKPWCIKRFPFKAATE